MSYNAAIEQLDDFTLAYLECILWTENDESTPAGGEPLDRNYTFDDFAPEAVERAAADCRRFQKENAPDLARYDHPQWTAAELGGHDLWLTRNGHGCGFWDRHDCLPEAAGEHLTKAAKKMGECYVTVGDDENIYLS